MKNNPTGRPLWRQSRLVPLVGAFAIVAALLATPAVAQVRDNANILQPETIRQATQVAEQLKGKHGRGLLIETYPAIPADLRAKFQSMPRDAFFLDWAQSRRTAQGVEGVVILVSMEAGRFEVAADPKTAATLFTKEDIKELHTTAGPLMGQRKFDDAISRSAAFVAKRIDYNVANGKGAIAAAPAAGGAAGGAATSGRPTPSPAGGSPAGGGATSSSERSSPASGGGGFGGFRIGTLVCFGVGAFVIFMLVKRMMAGRQQMGQGFPPGQGQGYGPGGPGMGQPGYGQPGYGQQGYGQPGRGGGLGTGLMGGLLGGVAGSYLGNKVFGQQAPGGDPAGDPNAAGPVAGDYGAGGGGGADVGGGTDFGSAGDVGGGADFGGGGDVGGGSDFGGGGE